MPENVRRIPLDQIVVSDRIRPVESAWAEGIAASMAEVGQQTPIVVRRTKDGRYELVAGAHRLAAARLLEWTEIVASVEDDMDDLTARLAEIDENLMRRELGPLDRALFLAERRRVYEKLHPETAHGKAKKPRKGDPDEKSQTLRLLLPPRFTAAAADKIGLSERAVQLSLAIAEGLGMGVAERLRGTAVEGNQAALQALAEMEPVAQRAVADALVEGKSFADARRAAGYAGPRDNVDPVAEQYNKAVKWFGDWDARTQATFLAEARKLRRKGGA